MSPDWLDGKDVAGDVLRTDTNDVRASQARVEKEIHGKARHCSDWMPCLEGLDLGHRPSVKAV